MRLRPFVYISESLITQQNAIEAITKCCHDCGYDPDPVLLEELWSEATQSTRSQLHKYATLSTGYKQPALKSWYNHVTSQLSPAIFSPNSPQTSDPDLAQSIFQCLSNPRSYYVPDEAAHFIADLEENDIQWGIIANDNHLYPLAVKYLGLRPFKIVSARQNLFKPLPSIFESAWRKVPVASQHDVWFVADATVPYDNVQSKFMNTAVYTHGKICDKSSQRLRIAAYEDLYSELGLQQDLELDFDMGASELREFLELPKNELLEKGKREIGLVDVPQGKPR